MGCLRLQFKFSSNMTPKKTISFAHSIDWSSIVIIISQFVCLWLGLNTAVSREVVLQKCKSVRDKVERFMGSVGQRLLD